MTGAPLLHLHSAALDARARGLRALGVLTPADLLLVDAVARRFGEADPDVLLGLALAVRAPRAGHVGVHLATARERVDDERTAWGVGSPGPPGAASGGDDPEAAAAAAWPADAAAWEAAVLASPMVGDPAQVTRPFVRQALADGRVLLMTRRLWREQERLAAAAVALASTPPALTLSEEALANGVRRLFGDPSAQGARAVATAAARRLTVVTGGPGTGKTYSIKRLLALLVEAAQGAGVPLRIALAAPTGKAAVRMAEAIGEDLGSLEVAEGVRQVLAEVQPLTLHKLLGMRPDGTSRHGAGNPLAADLVVVDEASMVDLALMRRLFEAVGAGARLVLLGDRDQLVSVEAGTVLADLVGPVLDGAAASDRALAAAVVPFRVNHRFRRAPTVAAIATALQARDDDQLAQVGRWMARDEVAPGETLADRVTPLGAARAGWPSEAQLDALAAPYLAPDGFVGQLAVALREHGPSGSAIASEAWHLALLQALEAYRVLAVHRRGPLGVSGLEQALAQRCQDALKQALRDRSGLGPEAPVRLPARGEQWLGRPVLVTQNAYEVGLMNGDIGLILPTERGLEAVFPVSEQGRPAARGVALARLPEHVGAFAMTVHKSQGSQFSRVAVVLAGRDSPIQTRELVYTAITRTRERLDWLGGAEELQRALRRRVARASGLGDLLWAAPVGGGA